MNKLCDDRRDLGQPARRCCTNSGLLAWTPDLAELPRLVDPYDESADLDRRARSYLQTNCAHCHQSNAGGTANIELGYDVPLEQTKTDRRPADPGNVQHRRSQDHRAWRPGGSVLYYRMSKLGGGRMPRVGSNQVDERATRMIHDWIAGMPAGQGPARTGTRQDRGRRS